MWQTIIVEEPTAKRETAERVADFEQRMRIILPADHREFLERFGEGIVFNHFRIFGLDKIESEAHTFQTRWQSFFLWDAPDSALRQEQMENCVIIGDTFNGDELVVSRDYPGEVFYFPQDEHRIVRMSSSLESALACLVEQLGVEIKRYPADEQAEWDLRPVFNRADF